jgi:hypothetical protein
MQDPKDYSEVVPAVEKDAQTVMAEGMAELRRLKEENEMLERMMAPQMKVIKSRGFFTRHVRSRAERTSKRKAQKAARKANR